jgi:ethanolamine ammonia-lyase small subunit
MDHASSKSLRDYTGARVALERTGSSVSVRDMLDLQLAHARARDAVHLALDFRSLVHSLSESNLIQERKLPFLFLESTAKDRATYLRRPDLGRELSQESERKLTKSNCDVIFILADGLSARAVLENAPGVLDATLKYLDAEQWKVGPICFVKEGRVAIGDTIGAALQAKFAVVLIGERPGLTSPNSMGVYITWKPQPERNDAERNCISNIHADGLSSEAVAQRISFYLHEGRTRQLTGVELKYSSLHELS